MKLRNQFIALACLLAFVGMGVLYVRMWVVQKPRQIILFVSDALSSRSLAAARLYAGGADHRLELEKFSNSALLRNPSEEFAVPDTASSATALATGKCTKHGAVSTTGTRDIETILERAHKSGRSVGIVSNASLASPSIAAFYAHSARPFSIEMVAEQLYEKEWISVALGGGAADFQAEKDGGNRKGRDLVESWNEKGVSVLRTKADLAMIDAGARVVGLFNGGPMAFANQMESGSKEPTLADMTRAAIAVLQKQRKGYVLVVDAALFTTACETNQAEKALREVLALDEAVSVAVREAGEKALILAVGRHSTGGLTLNGYPPRQQKKSDFLGLSPEGYPYLTWASGPNGPQPGSVPNRAEPAAVAQPSALNTAEDMLGLGRGPGSERLNGFLDNTVVFSILRSAL